MGSTPDLTTAQWRKSSHSAINENECIEIASAPGVAAVRDSQDPEGPVLTFTPAAFMAFVTATASGAFDNA